MASNAITSVAHVPPLQPASSILAKLGALSADIKIQHSVFALPWAILSAVLAAARTRGGMKFGQLALIVICMVTARTFAMLANRLLDAEVDAENPRTARRAIPSGRLSPRFMVVALAASAVLFILGAAGFWWVYKNPWPVILAIPVLAFLSGYPFLKRFSQLCHYYLGAALALAPVCAWIAIKGTIDAPPFYMFGAVLLWTAGFDILYACQDYAFDVNKGLFSIPAKFGIGRALWIARGTHLLGFAFLLLLGARTPELSTLYWIGAVIAGLLLIIEHALVKADDLSKLGLAFFTINGVISLMVGTFGVIDVLRRV